MVDLHISTNVKLLKTGKLRNSICPNCKNREHLEYRIYGGVGKVFLIPTAPTRRIVKVFCHHCQKEFKLKEVGDNIKQAIKYENQKAPIKTPIWQYTGAIILCVVLLLCVYTGIYEAKIGKVYIRKPLAEDVYYVNNNGTYTTYKVSAISKDSVVVLLNKLGLSSYNGIEDIDIKNNYTTPKSLSKKELIGLYDENIIYQINRPE